MPLSELTSREAVLSAIREYDALGQDAYLKKYSYGRARDYLLEFEGKTYDSKAIVGAAYGLQHPIEGPLKNDQFSGGLARVEPVLRRLGFTLSKIEPMDSQTPIKFELADFSLFSRYPSSKPFGDVAEPDKHLFQTIRQRLKSIAEDAASSFSTDLAMKGHASLYSPNGRSATDLWCCIYPAAAPNKSFAIQFALILNQHGAEFCCCLGAGTSQVSDPAAVAENANALGQVRRALRAVPPATIASVAATVDEGWQFRRQWRLKPGTADFSSLSEWLVYASSPTSSGASISKNLSVEEVVKIGPDIGSLFRRYAELFKPLIEVASTQNKSKLIVSDSVATETLKSLFNQARLKSAIRLFRWIYGDGGFTSDRYLVEERNYKLSLSQEWRETASRDRLRAAIAGTIPSDQLARDISALLTDSEKNGLVPPRYGDVLKGPWEKQQADQFVAAVYALLFEGDRTRPPIDEFNAAMEPFYAAKLSGGIKPASHCIPSIMLWLNDPQNYYFVRAGLYNRASVALIGSVAEGQGNVMTTGYYSSAIEFARNLARELADNDLVPQDMIDVQSFVEGVFRHSKVWFGGKSYGSTRDMFPEFLKRGVYAVGFARRDEVASKFEGLSNAKKEEREQRRSALEKLLSEGSENKAMTSFFDFASSPGDLILAKSVFYSQKTSKSTLRISGVGIVEDGYRFDPELGHQVPVAWRSEPLYDSELIGSMFPKLAGTLIALPISEALDAIGSPITSIESSYEDKIDEGEPLPKIKNNEPALEVIRVLQPVYTSDDFLRETHVDGKTLTNWLARARRKRQLILQGPPGTGKTFYAERLARLLVSGSAGVTEVVQFHPSYAYEDFIQGIRPQVVSGALTYNIEPGRFLRFCERAAKTGGSPCVLIVDEINRANLSRVFGELMYLLEYRDKEAPLAAGGTPFKIPENVFVIGTMNTADRSIALVDHALRRRFSIIYIEPDYNVLKSHLLENNLPAESLVNTLKAINAAINDRHYSVGISYFLADGKNLRSSLEDIWRGEIEPYLDEYFYDQEEKARAFRWDALSINVLADWK